MYEEMKTKEWISKLDVIRAEVEEMIDDEEFHEDLKCHTPLRYYPQLRIEEVIGWYERGVDTSIDEIINALENIQRLHDESQIQPEPEDDDEEEDD